MGRAVIVGASSGIGRSLASLLSAQGWQLGLAARREALLRELVGELPGPASIAVLDVTQPEALRQRLSALIQSLGGLDLFIYCAGVGYENPGLEIAPELETVAVNVQGFVGATLLAAEVFERQGRGHLVGISSLAAIRGNGGAPAYGASKAFMANYLEALHLRYAKARLPIVVTEVQPGFVDTAMAKSPVLFWVASPDKAAAQILKAIRDGRRKAIVTRRWRLFAWLMRVLPTRVLARLG